MTPNKTVAKAEDLIKYGMVNKNSTEQVKLILMVDDVLDKLYKLYAGAVYNPVKRAYMVEDGMPNALMSKEGLDRMMAMLSCRLSRVFRFNKFTEDYINSVMYVFNREITFLLVVKSREWNIKREDLPFLVNETVDIVHGALMVSLNGELLDYMAETTRTTQQSSISENQGGIGSFLRPK